MRKSFPALLSLSFSVVLGAMAAVTLPMPVAAQASDPALATVDGLDNGLLAIMHAGSGAGQAGRERQIAPVVDRSFDIPLMTRLSVGPAWLSFSAHDQAALIAVRYLRLGHPIGPFELMDNTAKSLSQSVHEILHAAYGERFLPRPLLFVDALPRNLVGKLPREAILGLAAKRNA